MAMKKHTTISKILINRGSLESYRGYQFSFGMVESYLAVGYKINVFWALHTALLVIFAFLLIHNVLIYIFFFFLFFIIQRVKARAILCLHQPPTRGDNTVSVAQGSTATPRATKQLLPRDRVLRELYIYIYIYTPDQLRAEITLEIFHVQFVILKKQQKKKVFTFRR